MYLNVFLAAPGMPVQCLVFLSQTHYVLQAFSASRVLLVGVLDKTVKLIYVQLVFTVLRVHQSQCLVFLVHTVQVQGVGCYLNVSTVQLAFTVDLMA